MSDCYRCGKKPANPLYCDECSDELAKAYASWAVKKISDEELDKILNKYKK